MSSSFFPVKKDFIIPQGVTWKQEIELDTDYFSFGTKEAVMTIKDISEYFEDIELTSSGGDILLDATVGLMTIIMSAEESFKITETGSYKIEFLETGTITVVERILKGNIIPDLDPTE